MPESMVDNIRSRMRPVEVGRLWAAGGATVRGCPLRCASPRAAAPIAAMRRLSSCYPSYGCQRIRIFPDRKGVPMSQSRVARLWPLVKVQLPRKRPHRRIARGRPRPLSPHTRDHVGPTTLSSTREPTTCNSGV